jgi:hypothetical protein
MRKALLILCLILWISSAAFAQFSFYLIENFEGGADSFGSKWWRFGDLKAEIVKNPSPEANDLIAASCGEYSLNLTGETRDWYVGGIGTNLSVDASNYSRFQVDVYGNDLKRGKLVIELFDDDNQNYSIEQDPKKNYEPIYDDKWVAEVNILGRGFTRVSIPFTAFRDVNPGVGDDIWNPFQKDGSGGLLKLQLVAITERQVGAMNFRIDDLLLTY